jgi:hypothetical protein
MLENDGSMNGWRRTPLLHGQFIPIHGQSTMFFFRKLSCPLNIMDNGHHSFAQILRQKRMEALQRARELPIANEHDQKR